MEKVAYVEDFFSILEEVHCQKKDWKRVMTELLKKNFFLQGLVPHDVLYYLLFLQGLVHTALNLPYAYYIIYCSSKT